jgi:hypothetical protein
LDLLDGCYNVWPLPNFETAADIQYTKEAGAMASGASTVPEQLAATFLGVDCIGFAVPTNPATGIQEDHVHDGEHNLRVAAKCLVGLKAVIWRLVEKYQFNPEHRLNLNYCGVNSLRLKQVHSHHLNADQITTALVKKVLQYTSGHPIRRVRWFMSGPLYE